MTVGVLPLELVGAVCDLGVFPDPGKKVRNQTVTLGELVVAEIPSAHTWVTQEFHFSVLCFKHCTFAQEHVKGALIAAWTLT